MSEQDIVERLQEACGYKNVEQQPQVRGYLSSATNGLVLDAAAEITTLRSEIAEYRVNEVDLEVERNRLRFDLDAARSRLSASEARVGELEAGLRYANQRLNESGSGVMAYLDTIHAVAAVFRSLLNLAGEAPGPRWIVDGKDRGPWPSASGRGQPAPESE